MLTKYGVTSIPTLMLFRGGEVVYRTSHFDTETSLRKKINQIIATDTKVFVERRHRDKRREGQRRRYEPLQSVIWRDLKNELHRTPWPVVVSINPEDPVLNEDFASLVESVVEKLRVMGLKALHVTGSPTKQVKRHFGITIDAPGVAVFYEGKLIGQFENIRSAVDLRKRLRNVLP